MKISFPQSILISLTLGCAACGSDAVDQNPATDAGSVVPDAGTVVSTPDAGPVDSAVPETDAGNPTQPAPNAVYTLSNDGTQNAIVAFERAEDGTLAELDSFATGGSGSGAGLGSQNALIFDSESKRFFAVNAGDNTISMLSLESDGKLAPESTVSSGGIKPVSIAASGDLVYVVNAGDDSNPANISGFFASGGSLSPIPDSSRPLSADAPGPGQIQFSKDGSILVVTEKGTSKIDTFIIHDGLADGPIVHSSAGMTPFGFAMSDNGDLVVSEAFGGMDNAGATSSYVLNTSRSVPAPVSSSIPSGQSAPCWVVVVGDYAYVTNTKSNSVSAYEIAEDGTLALTWSAPTGEGPIDAAISEQNDFLYVLNGKADSLSIYAVDEATGALSQKPDLSGLPEAAVGLAVGPVAVYTMSNDSAGNGIVAHLRAVDGSLSLIGSFSTGGLGNGAGLGSQGSLIIDSANSRLFAVNAGDNTISMFAVEADGRLTLKSNVDSGGAMPVSITQMENTVYVLNAGDMATPGNITGFTISGTDLIPIPDSTQPLSSDSPGAAQIQFESQSLLVVTEKKTNKILTYTVQAGVANAPTARSSMGLTPFGFAFSANGQLIVSEAFGGMDNLGAASSYSIGTSGSLSPISASVTSGQSAPCWVALTGNHAYVTNTKSGNLSAYEVASDGALSLLWNAQTGAKPIDASVSLDGGFLYVLNAGDHSLSIYGIDANSGLLTEKSPLAGLPEHAVGLIAR